MGTKRKNAPGAGRPRVYGTELPIYDSMEQMANATGIPLAALKHAKKNGCLFVRHSRCNLAEFLSWFFNQSEDGEDGIDWAKRDKRAKALMSEIDLEKKRDRVIEWSAVERFISKLVRANFFGELDRLANEFPAVLKGKNEVQINVEVSRQIGIIREALEREANTFINTKGKNDED